MKTNFYNESSKFSATRLLNQPAYFRLSSGALFSMIILSLLTARAFAVCQTPQFGNPIVLTVNNPYSAVPADYNRDGRVDLAVLSSADGAIEILLGNGSSFVSTGTRYSAVQSTVGEIATGDFNNDGFLDLVATGGPSAQRVAAILLGNGSGGFGPPTNFSVGTFPTSVKTADFNNDGNLDIITANDSGSTVSILPGQGNGTFTAAFSVTVNNNPNSIVVSDFNNDGRADFITASTNDDTIAIKLGNGNFTFANPNPATLNLTNPNALTTNDFNRDGRSDFAATNLISFANDSVSVRLGTGTGVFNLPSSDPFTIADSVNSITSADLNSDGFPDIATANAGSGGSDNLSILFNNGIGGFSSTFNFTIANGISTKVYAADFNQNGASDLVILKEDTTDRLVLLPNTCLSAARTPFDFDGDGKADVSAFRPSNGTWYLLNSAAGFAGIQFGLGTDKLAPADYDGDGKTDLGVFRGGTWFLQRSQTGYTAVSFGTAGDLPVPADFDGDGRADLAVFRPSNGAWYIQRSTSGAIGTLFGQNGDKPVPADYDGDGKADIAVYRAGIWYIQRSQLGFTGISFGIAEDKPVPADYDGDGKMDVAVFRPSNGAWYLQRSNLGFTTVNFGTSADLPAAADYDGDGKADVAVFRPSNGTWYLNRSSSGFTSVQFGANGDAPAPGAFVP